MKSLRRKMFWLLFSSLLMLTTVLVFIAGYREYTSIQDSLMEDLLSSGRFVERVSRDLTLDYSTDDEEEIEDFKTRLSEPFTLTMFLPTYVVLMEKNTISEIIYFNTSGEDIETIYDLAEHIITSTHSGQVDSGNLLYGDYAWNYQKNGSITIINIEGLRAKLFQFAGYWLLLYTIAILLLIWLCRTVVSWMIRPIEATFAKQKQFIADASHELKTPLAVIYSNTQAYEKDHDEKWIQNIQSETERMNRLITDLLELTRLENQSLKKVPVNLSRLTEKESLSLEAIMFEKGITLEENIEPNLFIEANEDQIRQVIRILIDNAIHHAKDTIEVSLVSKGNEVTLSVSNNGEPIDKQDLPHIFERFYRSSRDRNRNENRYGLGLAIAKNIIDLHSGNIQVNSTEEKTTFCLIFRKFNNEKG